MIALPRWMVFVPSESCSPSEQMRLTVTTTPSRLLTNETCLVSTALSSPVMDDTLIALVQVAGSYAEYIPFTLPRRVGVNLM